MNILNRYITGILFIIVMQSCIKSANHNKEFQKLQDIGKEKVILERREQKTFPLDSITSPFALPTSYYNGRYFCLNTLTQEIIVYDFESANITQRIDINYGSCNAEQIYVNNLNSIFVSDYKKQLIVELDSLGVRINTYRLPRKRKEGLKPAINIGDSNPVIEFNNSLYFSGYLFGEYNSEEEAETRTVGVEYNPTAGAIADFMAYPQFYIDNNVGGMEYRRVYAAYNDVKREMVFSFPASHNLYVYNLDTKSINIVNAGSRFIDDIPSFGYQKKDNQGIERDCVYYYYRNNSYGIVLYDKYKKLYYRVALQSNKDFELGLRNNYLKNMSIVIFNEKFERLGETLVHKNYIEINAFVCSKGLALKCFDMTNESQISYDIFTPKYK